MEPGVAFAKVLIATSAALIVLAAWRADRVGAPFSRRARAIVAVFGILLGAAAHYDFELPVAAQRDGFHRAEMFHHFIGAKYFAELRYDGIYACTLAADGATRRDVYRDLSIGRLVRADSPQATASSERCRARFSTERWQAFTADIAWFRTQFRESSWISVLKDHGHNSPPPRAVLNSVLIGDTAASLNALRWLSLCDPFLLVVMFAAIAWAFGLPTAAVCAIGWGCLAPARSFWIDGALLRQDWLACTVIAACAAKRQRYVTAAALLAFGAALRVVPLIPLVMLLALGAWSYWSERTAGARTRLERLVIGAVATGTLAFLVGASAGVGVYSEWAGRMETYRESGMTDKVGLRTLAEHSRSSRMQITRDDDLDDPFSRWTDARHAAGRPFALFVWALTLAAAIGVAHALRDERRLWIAVPLSLPLVFSLTQLPGYYVSIFLLAGLLATIRPGIAASFLVTAAGTSLFSASFYWMDDKYAAYSALLAVFSVLILVGFRNRRRSMVGRPANEVTAARSCSFSPQLRTDSARLRR